MKQILAILLFLLLPLWATVSAAPIISGISQNEIKIDSKFTGEKILLFGAKNEPGNIIAVVRGPKHNFLLNKKEKSLGIWHNSKQVTFYNTYSFYNLFAAFLGKELNQQNLLDFEIGKHNLNFFKCSFRLVTYSSVIEYHNNNAYLKFYLFDLKIILLLKNELKKFAAALFGNFKLFSFKC